MVRVGIVAEGKSEWLVLEAVMQAIHQDIEFVRIRPDLDMLSGDPFGWRGVKSWCAENGRALDAFMKGVENKPLDILVVHCDCSMADKVGANHPCPPPTNTANALRQVIIAQWLGLADTPWFVVLATPSRMIDAWVVATLDPPYRKLATIECEEAVENELVARHLLRKKGKEVKKQERRYAPLAKQVGDQLARVRSLCSEAERFASEFHAVVAGPPVA